MKTKEILKKTQPTLYRILKQSFKDEKQSHAYLLIGTNTGNAAMFMAQSFICENDLLACEDCNECRRIKENNYSDFILIDGNERSIKKEDIEYIQKQFSKSSLEGGAKIYLLKNIENSSTVAMNSLLKFLEEPVEGVYAILTTKNINKVLPTIQSRCQIVHLLPESKESIQLELFHQKVEEEDSYVLSQLFSSYEAAYEFGLTDDYREIKLQVLNFIEDLYLNPINLLINQQIHIVKKYKSDKDMMKIYLNMIILGLRDMFHVKHSLTPIFMMHKDLFKQLPEDKQLLDKIETILNTIYLIDTNANIALLIDSMCYKLMKGVQ